MIELRVFPAVVRRCFPMWVMAAATLASAAGAPLAARVVPARVVSSDAGRVVFSVRVPEPRFAPSASLAGFESVHIAGFDAAGASGEPGNPVRQFLVAVPATGTWRVSSRIVSSSGVGAHRLEPVPYPAMERDDVLGKVLSERFEHVPEVYDAARPVPVVVAAEEVWIRRNRVVPVFVRPLVVDPATNATIVATEIEITVTFAGSTRPGDSAATTADAPMWDELAGRLFVNPDQARTMRRAEDRPRVDPGFSSALPALPGGMVKLRVRDTAMHRVTAARVMAAGFPVGEPVANLHLFQRTYNETTLQAGVQDIACHVEEDPTGTAGIFDGNDRVIFFGRSLREDAVAGDTIEKFSDHNIYWLASDGGPRMATRALSQGFVGADTAGASFPVNDHVEIDTEFREETPPGIAEVYYFNSGNNVDPVDMLFTMGAVKPGTNVTLQAELHGQFTGFRALKISTVSSGGETILDGAFGIFNKVRRVFSASVPGVSFTVGTNRFRAARPDASRATLQALLNWVEVSYSSLYRARANRLDFNTASLAGDTTIAVTRLSTSNHWLFDVTAPESPVRCLVTPNLFTPDGGGFTFAFRDNVGAQKKYMLLAESGMTDIVAADVIADAPSGLVGNPAENGVDVLVVAYKDYIAQMDAWATYRRAQGYRVLMADVDDVMDEFNNGVSHARGIRRFVRRFYALGGASVLVLVGDSSEDNRRIYSNSGQNFVPTDSWPDAIPQLDLDEIVTTDKRYVKMPGGGGIVDAYPDMIVGRLPAGTQTELAAMLAKTYAFEKPKADDFWRKRIVVFADDEYSEGSSSFGGFQFCDNNEAGFESGQENTARVIENSLPAGYDLRRFFMSQHTAAIYTQQCASKQTVIRYARDNITPLWMNELNAGATLVTMQSHMNRSLVTHERVFATLSPGVLGTQTGGYDHLRVDNRGRPWVMFAMGCHFSDYALHREESDTRVSDNTPNGDCFAEQLLFQINKGAVATYASSGYEYLHETNAFMNQVARIWFYEAPYDTAIATTQGQWILGQLMFLVENGVAGSQANPVERYHILGDPLLHIDAGPPAFDVTVNGAPFASGGLVQSGGEGDTLRVVAVVTDENAIQQFKLLIDGVDATAGMTVAPLVDPALPAARQYRLTFAHVLQPSNYDIVLQAFQARDATSGQFSMQAEFRLRVETVVRVSVNGRRIATGDRVPARGDYLVEVTTPVFIPEAEIAVTIDSVAVNGLSLSHPSPQDSTTWNLRFGAELAPGTHLLRVSAGQTFEFHLVVSNEVGLREVIPYPNPFRETTHIVFSNDVEISDGTIDIFTTSGKRVRRLYIPPQALVPGQNGVFWDGRDNAGGEIANGSYLYVVRVTQRGQSSIVRGKMSKIK